MALLLAVALIAAACAGDDDATGTTAEDTATTQAPTEDDTTTTEAEETTTTAAPAEGEAGPIWVLLPDSATSPRWETDDRRFFSQALSDAGVAHTIVNAEGDATTQQAQAEQAIASGASVIILTSLDTGSGAAIIDIAKEAGVPVVEYDRFNTGSSGGAVYVSFDNEQVGATMAEVLTPFIDALEGTPQVVMLNGGETDNNSFLFRNGYNATVEEKVAAGEWELVADQFTPNWGGSGEGQTLMEQILVSANNDVDAVFAANDNLANQTINALEAAGLDVATIPISGQDATATGLQNIVLSKQTMTVYKPIEPEAKVAAAAALALRDGREATDFESEFEFRLIGINTADGQPTDSPEGDGVVPYIALTPIGVTVDNIAETVIADNFRTVAEICVGDAEQTQWCQENQ